MTQLAIDNAATDSMMQLTVRTGFTRNLSGGYKIPNGSLHASYSLRMEGEAIKQSVVHESTAETRTESMSVLRRQMAMANEFYKKQSHSDVYVVLFTFLAYF